VGTYAGGGFESIVVILAEGSFSQTNELACNSLSLHGESPARFSVIPSLGEDTPTEELAYFPR
jgi:hypothetical protein